MTAKVAETKDDRTRPGAVSPEAEQAVLGALLSDEGVWKHIEDLWSEDLFAADPANTAIARVIEHLAKAGRTVDAVLVQVELDRRGELGRVVAPELPFLLARSVGTTANVRYYMDVLHDFRKKRGAAPDGLERFSIRTAIEEADDLEAEVQHLPTGWGRLDARLGGGLPIPSFTVLGAAPKSGKSTWATMIAERYAQSGGFAYVLDLENGRKLFLRRLIARRAKVGLRDLLSALRQKKEGIFRSRDEVERWQKAKAEVHESGKNLFVEHRLEKAEDLTQRLRALRHRAKDRPILVVIDSLQKLPMRMDERRAGVDWWLRTLDRLREELNLVIIAVSELKRGEEGYEAREDTFKESGGVEYTAQVGLTMTRPSVEGDEAPEEVTTLRVVFARDADENPKGVVACYRPLYPWYGLEECDAPGRMPAKRDAPRPPRSTKTPRLFPEEGEA